MNEEPTEEQLWEMLPEQVGVAKVATLIDLTHASAQRNDYGNALSIAETGVDTAREEDDQILAKALVTRAHVYWHLDKYQESAEDYIQAATIFERYESLLEASRGYYDACRAYYRADHLDVALDLNAKAQEFADASEDYEAMGRCWLQKARLQDELFYPVDEIIASLDAGKDALREGQLARYVLDAEEHKMEVLAAHDRFDEALAAARRCLYFGESVSEGKSAYFNYMMAWVLRQAGRSEEGFAYLDKSEEINKSLEDYPALASCMMERARALRELKRYDEVPELLAKARVHFDFTGLDHAIFNCDMVAITTLRDTGAFDEALAKSRAQIENSTDALELFVLHLQIADTFFEMGRLAEAKAELDALTIDESWVGRESAWFTYRRILATTLKALGMDEAARAIAMKTLAEKRIKVTYEGNRVKLRALAAE